MCCQLRLQQQLLLIYSVPCCFCRHVLSVQYAQNLHANYFVLYNKRFKNPQTCTTHQRAMSLLLLLLLLQQEISVVFLYFFWYLAIKARCAARPCWNVLPRCIPCPRCRQKGDSPKCSSNSNRQGREYVNPAVSQHTADHIVLSSSKFSLFFSLYTDNHLNLFFLLFFLRPMFSFHK